MASVAEANKGSQPLVPQNDLVNKMEMSKYFCKRVLVTALNESCTQCVFICRPVCRCSVGCGVSEDSSLLCAGDSKRLSPQPAGQVGVARGSRWPAAPSPRPRAAALRTPVCRMPTASL